MIVLSFSESLLRQIANALENAATHRELSSLLAECCISVQGGGPKWERMLLALSARQKRDGCGNNVVAFIQAVMNPVLFVSRREQFSEIRLRLNEVLAFAALQASEDGKLRPIQIARTL